MNKELVWRSSKEESNIEMRHYKGELVKLKIDTSLEEWAEALIKEKNNKIKTIEDTGYDSYLECVKGELKYRNALVFFNGNVYGIVNRSAFYNKATFKILKNEYDYLKFEIKYYGEGKFLELEKAIEKALAIECWDSYNYLHPEESLIDTAEKIKRKYSKKELKQIIYGLLDPFTFDEQCDIIKTMTKHVEDVWFNHGLGKNKGVKQL
jgi:hypothetical protein